jgi:hypothetical protein
VTDTKLPLSNRLYNSIVDDHGERAIAVRDLCDLFGVDALIRVHEQDYALIDQLPEKYVHFNLEFTLNEQGKRYAILPIVKPGFRKQDNEEVLPVLDPTRYRIGRCDAIQQQVPVENVSTEHFQHSISTIRTVDELKKALLQRYGRRCSLPSHQTNCCRADAQLPTFNFCRTSSLFRHSRRQRRRTRRTDSNQAAGYPAFMTIAVSRFHKRAS